MRKWSFGIVACAIGLTAVIGQAAGVLAAEFYKDKTVRIIVPYSPGGGFDSYTRLFARHMGKQIPGTPKFIVQNMPGGSGIIGPTYVYNIAKPDGLTVGITQGYKVIEQLLGGPGIKFDVRRFQWIGMPGPSVRVCAFMRASGITSLEKWKQAKTPVPIGASARGSTRAAVMVLKEVLGLPVQIVTGYRGTANIRMAAERGELAGACFSWDSLKMGWQDALEAGEVAVVLQLTTKPHPDLPDVPIVMDLAKTEEARRLVYAGAIVYDDVPRIFMVPPGTPKTRVQTLRKAFMDTVKDPEFLSDVEKTGLKVEGMSGEEVEKIVDNLFKLDPDIVAKLKELLM